jgi:hypothetical protein
MGSSFETFSGDEEGIFLGGQEMWNGPFVVGVWKYIRRVGNFFKIC